MQRTLNFYMDESGSRRPNHEPATIFDPPLHFAMGGILVNDEDEPGVRAQHAAFCKAWRITDPLHSVEIRNGQRNFAWLRADSSVRNRFMTELSDFLTNIPVLGVACVIDRPGYDALYRPRYGRNQWALCKTAFSVAVERACKHARACNRKLRVLPEGSNKSDEEQLTGYFNEMRNAGLPFCADNSAQYSPLAAADMASALYELTFKRKSSPMAQLADLYLWPIAKSGYGPDRAHQQLYSAGRILDCHLSSRERAERGVKFSCFGHYKSAQGPETTKARTVTFEPL